MLSYRQPTNTMPHYERNDLHSRPSQARTPDVNTSRRSWGSNGFHFTVETTSFSSPGPSFSPFADFGAGALRHPFLPPQSSSRSTGANVLGTAFNLFGQFVSLQQQHQQQQLAAELEREKVQDAARDRNSRKGRRSSRKQYAEGPPEARRSSGTDSRRNGHRVRFSESPVEDMNEKMQGRQRRRDRSPVIEIPKEEWESNRRSSQRKARASAPWAGRFGNRSEEATEEELSDDSESDYDDSDGYHGSGPYKSSTSNNGVVVEALQKAKAEHYQKIRELRRRIQVAAVLPTSSGELRIMREELKVHEAALAAVKQNLRDLKVGKSSRRSKSYHSRPSPAAGPPPPSKDPGSRGPWSQTAGPQPFVDAFGFGDFEAFFGPRRTSHPGRFGDFDNPRGFSAFGASPFGPTDNFFNDPLFEPVFGIPRSPRFSDYSTANGFPPYNGPRPQYPPQSSTPVFPTTPLNPVPKPQPPPTLLQPQEAKSLFQKYNDRWNALAPTDTNIPYPCRGLQARALTARDSLWAPDIKSPTATWSEEIVMQANAQAFYLGVVGLSPTYTEGTGNIGCGFDKARATPAQKQQLIDILKKEKTRWHSDRLGRRNGGGADAGVNEKLQRDDRARAVFHAVCELMEFTQ